MRIFNFLILTAICTLNISVAYGSVFSIQMLSEDKKNQMIEFKTWQPSCPVPLERLRVIHFSYYDFKGAEQDNGEIVVLDAVSKRVITIFKALHAAKFPIAKATPIEHYKGNDEESMNDNNSCSFNCREITGGGLPSVHSYGLAIDINPIQNPYISFNDKGHCTTKIYPNAAKEYMNRTNLRFGMVEHIVEIFKKNGFTVWGGKWNTPIDWQHFQPPRPLAQLLGVMSPSDAAEFFEMFTITHSKLFDTVNASENNFVTLYQQSPQKFMQNFRNKKKIFKLMPEQAIDTLKK